MVGLAKVTSGPLSGETITVFEDLSSRLATVTDH
jgi:hypothetical protein